MKTIVSTKKLNPGQRALLEQNNLTVLDYDALHISFQPFDLPSGYRNLIFSSQNAVRAFLRRQVGDTYHQKEIINCFCVGDKTRSLLEKNGYPVVHTSDKASDLADYLVRKFPDTSFLFLCGNRRRDELPKVLKANHIALEECQVYKTEMHSVKLEGPFDAVLFFSPSGVESFCTANTLGRAKAFCIGSTTAAAVDKYTTRYSIVTKPSADRLIRLALHEMSPSDCKDANPVKKESPQHDKK